jgi:hypothetical protein
MEEITLSPGQLANAAAEAKALELQSKLNIFKVHPLVFKDEATGEFITGFVREPERIHKKRILDKSVMGSVTAASDALDILLIKEFSDARIYSEDQQYDDINLGAVMACYDLIKYKVNTFKKNS